MNVQQLYKRQMSKDLYIYLFIYLFLQNNDLYFIVISSSFMLESLQIMKPRKKKIINQKQNHQLHNPNMQTKNRSYKIIGFLYDLVPVIQVEIGTPCTKESGVCFESLVSHVQISMILGYSVYLEKP